MHSPMFRAEYARRKALESMFSNNGFRRYPESSGLTYKSKGKVANKESTELTLCVVPALSLPNDPKFFMKMSTSETL